MKKTIATLLGLLFAVAVAVPSAQAQATPGCYSVTFSATGQKLLFTNSTKKSVDFSASYYTTGSPSGVSILIETGNVPEATSEPFTAISALTDTTKAQFAQYRSGALYWYANLGTLSGGTSPTVILHYCLREVDSATATTLVASTSVTGTGAMVLENTPTLVTPVIGAATGTSLDLTGGLDTGVAGSTVGTVVMHNGTSGDITISPGTGALGTVTMTAPNMGASSAILASTLTTNTAQAANSVWGASNAILMEGATADGFELTITPADPAIDTTVTIPAIASGAHTVGAFEVTFHDETTGIVTDRTFYVAPRGVIVNACSEVHSVAAGGTSTIMVVKDTGTSAPGAGTDILSAAFDLNGTANTVVAKTSGDFVSLAARTLAAGDRLSVDYTAAIQSSAGIMITCTLLPN